MVGIYRLSVSLFDVRSKKVCVLQLCPFAVPHGRACRMGLPRDIIRCIVDMRIGPAFTPLVQAPQAARHEVLHYPSPVWQVKAVLGIAGDEAALAVSAL